MIADILEVLVITSFLALVVIIVAIPAMWPEIIAVIMAARKEL